MTTTIDLDLVGARGTLRLLPLRADGPEGFLIEGERYVYRLIDPDGSVGYLEPSELFEPDPDNAVTGRFAPRECVGTLRLAVHFQDGPVGVTEVEVRPVKLSYETQYRAMLDQIADHAAEAVLQGFAPATAEVHPDAAREGELRYRSLAFLLARFRQPAFVAALERIRTRPDRGWSTESEIRPVGKGAQASAQLARTLSRGPTGAARPGHLDHLPMDRLPRQIESTRTESSYDTPANRFVRFTFSRWQGLALEVLRDLQHHDDSTAGPRRRGRAEAKWAADYCEEVLASPALRDAGRMHGFPHGNQVLLRQPGYREVLRTFALTEATIALEASLPDDPFSATQRNVATLYEYWCFVAFVETLTRLLGVKAEGSLFRASPHGMSLVLREGSESRIAWEASIDGRVLLVELWFNRSFSPRAVGQSGSWSRVMRPDISLRIRPRTGRPTDLQDPELDVWLHFDAKYRIELIAVGAPVADDEDNADVEASRISAKREDLLKMHAYRDSIRRSVGAYVLYPGVGDPELKLEFHEILPGLGAFPLRPDSDGVIEGQEDLQVFINHVVEHVSNQASAMERSAYWNAVTNRRPGNRTQPVDFLAAPPADTPVLVGYARRDQLAWISREKLYNLRTGDRPGAVDATDEMLSAPILVLWGGRRGAEPVVYGVFERVGPWQIATEADMAATGYPMPDGHYLISPFEPLASKVERLVRSDMIDPSLTSRFGAPYSVTWAELADRSPGGAEAAVSSDVVS